MSKIITPLLLCFTLVFTLPAICSANSKDAPPKVKKTKFEGTWIATSAVKEGVNAPANILKQLSFRFEGEKLFVRDNLNNGKYREVSSRLDQSKTPIAFDMTPPHQKQAILGIIERKDNVLKCCFREPDSEKGRPTEFKSFAGSETILIVFKLKDCA